MLIGDSCGPRWFVNQMTLEWLAMPPHGASPGESNLTSRQRAGLGVESTTWETTQ